MQLERAFTRGCSRKSPQGPRASNRKSRKRVTLHLKARISKHLKFQALIANLLPELRERNNKPTEPVSIIVHILALNIPSNRINQCQLLLSIDTILVLSINQKHQYRPSLPSLAEPRSWLGPRRAWGTLSCTPGLQAFYHEGLIIRFRFRVL